MADEKLTLKPVVTALDNTSQAVITQEIDGIRKVVQANMDLLRGLDGVSAIASITDATPAAIPAINATAQYGVDSSEGLSVGQIVAIGAAASLEVMGLPTAQSIVLKNIDAPVGAVVTGAKIAPSGKPGAPGAPGANSTVPGPAGVSAFTTVTTAFTIPAAPTGTVAVVFGSTAFLNIGNTVAIGAFYFKVTGISSATNLTLQNDRTGQSGTVAATTKVTIAGEPGPAGAGGSGAVPVGSIYYQWATSTAASDPTDGFLKANNASVDLATTIYVNETDIETSNRAALLSQITAGGILRIQKVADGAYVDFTVTTNTDNGAWRSISVAFSAGSNTPTLSLTANESVVLAWLPIPGSSNAGGGGLNWQLATVSVISAAADTGYVADSTASQRFTLPSTVLGKKIAVQSISPGVKEIVGAEIQIPSGMVGLGLRNVVGASGASVELLCTAPSKWALNNSSAIAHWELFDPTGYDTDAISVFTAIESVLTSNSLATTLLTSSIKTAVNNRILAAKNNLTWSGTAFYYGFLGGAITVNATVAAAIDKINFRTPGVADIISYSTAFTHTAQGMAPPNTAALAVTGISANKSYFPDAGFAMACYLTTDIPQDDARLLSAGTVNKLELTPGVFGQIFYPYGPVASHNPSGVRLKGYRAGSRLNATQIIQAVQGVVSNTVNNSPEATASLGNFNIGSSSFGTTARFGSACVASSPWTGAQILQDRLDEIVYQTALNRN